MVIFWYEWCDYKKKRENMADDNNINSISILIVFLK